MDQSQWDELYAGTELVWTAEANRFVVEELAGLTAGPALDLGTGEGRNAIWLDERGWQVTAVDFSAVGLAKAAELAARRGVTGVRWVEADLREYQPGPAACCWSSAMTSTTSPTAMVARRIPGSCTGCRTWWPRCPDWPSSGPSRPGARS